MLAQLYTGRIGCLVASYFLVNHMTNAYILRLPCLTYAKFNITKGGHTLAESVLETFQHLTEDECENECKQHRLCKSINTRKATGENCQLISKSTEDPFDNVRLTAMSEWEWQYKTTDHRARNIGYLCEEKNPCPIEQVCIDTCTCPGYECQETQSSPTNNCQEAYNKGYKTTSVVPIHVPSMGFINVRCDMVTDGGGWIVFQRRVDASVDFFLEWNEYKAGFGDLNGNFWLGLEKLHKLALPGKGAMLRVNLKHSRDPTLLRYAEYTKFEILSESQGYKLQVDGYSGDAGDSLSNHNNCGFSTKNHDQDAYDSRNCANYHKGAWWYKACYKSNLNAQYPTNNEQLYSYIGWKTLYGDTHGGVIFSEMKLKYSNP